MMRNTVSTSRPSAGARAIDAQRLTAVRGGDNLGITIDVPTPSPAYMSLQHNETIAQL